ncbi:DNA-binding anti-repressor SinI [Robertmurraya yapensis]|uniref:DNA-binding anti-repressor SinI n=2 Tax=Bacillaceae TaxID=186817 RepID=A0A431W8Z6_9BACI|nr:anti-repressor SinI family protein [Bacillus yapensis]RTR31972.1 DNA-binding anti-repressor SinI [Bacillus yapensis]TKS95986.1 DNA-binding anti-repressor SinI [Bacillus yapensis]
MVIEVRTSIEGLDTEWLELIKEAKKLGIEKEEIREFLNKKEN